MAKNSKRRRDLGKRVRQEDEDRDPEREREREQEHERPIQGMVMLPPDVFERYSRNSTVIIQATTGCYRGDNETASNRYTTVITAVDDDAIAGWRILDRLTQKLLNEREIAAIPLGSVLVPLVH